jgi:hypothetical protein
MSQQDLSFLSKPARQAAAILMAIGALSGGVLAAASCAEGWIETKARAAAIDALKPMGDDLREVKLDVKSLKLLMVAHIKNDPALIVGMDEEHNKRK